MAFQGEDVQDYLIRFVNTMDPNEANSEAWPKYRKSHPNLLQLGDDSKVVVQDTYRKEAIEKLIEVSLAYPM